MGLFDFFKPKTSEPAKKSSSIAKWAQRAVDKRGQTYERNEALEALADLGTAEAAEALLKRFTFAIDPSISDQEEKEIAFRGVLNAGREALEPIRAFARAVAIAPFVRGAREHAATRGELEERRHVVPFEVRVGRVEAGTG